MSTQKTQFSISKMKEVIQNQSNKRVSRDSAEELSRELQMYGSTIADLAISFAEEDGRKTVRAEDIKAALNADVEDIRRFANEEEEE